MLDRFPVSTQMSVSHGESAVEVASQHQGRAAHCTHSVPTSCCHQRLQSNDPSGPVMRWDSSVLWPQPTSPTRRQASGRSPRQPSLLWGTPNTSSRGPKRHTDTAARAQVPPSPQWGPHVLPAEAAEATALALTQHGRRGSQGRTSGVRGQSLGGRTQRPSERGGPGRAVARTSRGPWARRPSRGRPRTPRTGLRQGQGPRGDQGAWAPSTGPRALT